MIFYPVISLCAAFYCVWHFTVSSSILCPTHYCVQHIIVSNKILCPHLPKGSFFTFHISMCCGRIMLHLRSTSVFLSMYNCLIYMFSAKYKFGLKLDNNVLCCEAVFRSKIQLLPLISMLNFYPFVLVFFLYCFDIICLS